jgi:hypothetical protein
MRWRQLVGMFVVAAGLTAFVIGARASGPAGAAGKWKLIVPGVAADSARPPAPTPTPVFDDERWIRVEVRIRALELAATGSGTLPVLIQATVEAPVRSALDPPVTVVGDFSITPEGTDAAGCTWTRTDARSDFKMTVYYNSAGNLDALLSFVSPEWHYTVTCPAVGVVTRSPTFGEEGLELFLRDLMAPYRTNEVPNGVRLPMSTTTADQGLDPCIRRSAYLKGSGIQTNPAEVAVWVYQPGYPGQCNPALPPLPPLDWDDLAPLVP